MMHVEALQWLNCIFARRLRANCLQSYELGNANNDDDNSRPGVPKRVDSRYSGWPRRALARGLHILL